MFTKLVKLGRILLNGRYRYGLPHGVAAAVEHESVLRCLSYRTLLDIGANKGQFSSVSKGVNPEAKIFAFEPLPDAAAKYKSLFSNRKDVKLYEAAIGPQSADADIYVSRRDDSSSLLPIGHLQENHFPGTGLDRVEKIRTARLVDCISAEDLTAPVLMKIDVQGFELEALKGCSELMDSISIFIVECSFVELYEGQALAHQVIQHLRQAGAILSGVYNISCDSKGLPLQADFLFRRAAG